MLDENEFLSPYGIRSLSRYHAAHPYVVHAGGQEYRVSYLPAESDTGMFGGNSNWRGPIWMPVNALIIRALLQYYLYYGDDFTVECPTGSGRRMNLYQVAEELSRRLTDIFLKDDQGRRRDYAFNGLAGDVCEGGRIASATSISRLGLPGKLLTDPPRDYCFAPSVPRASLGFGRVSYPRCMPWSTGGAAICCHRPRGRS